MAIQLVGKIQHTKGEFEARIFFLFPLELVGGKPQDAGTLFHGFDEFNLLKLFDEGERITAGVTGPAAEEAALIVHGHGGLGVWMKRAEPNKCAALTFQGNIMPHDLRDRRLLDEIAQLTRHGRGLYFLFCRTRALINVP
jgi:hypothetical protein